MCLLSLHVLIRMRSSKPNNIYKSKNCVKAEKNTSRAASNLPGFFPCLHCITHRLLLFVCVCVLIANGEQRKKNKFSASLLASCSHLRKQWHNILIFLYTRCLLLDCKMHARTSRTAAAATTNTPPPPTRERKTFFNFCYSYIEA